MARKKDFGIDEVTKHLLIISDIETLLNTVFTLFSTPAVKKAIFEELANVTVDDILAFCSLNEVRWLSKKFFVKTFIRNYDLLIN